MITGRPAFGREGTKASDQAARISSPREEARVASAHTIITPTAMGLQVVLLGQGALSGDEHIIIEELLAGGPTRSKPMPLPPRKNPVPPPPP
jgi:hypothetical protein